MCTQGAKKVCLICCASKDDPNLHPCAHEQLPFPVDMNFDSLLFDRLLDPYMAPPDSGNAPITAMSSDAWGMDSTCHAQIPSGIAN